MSDYGLPPERPLPARRVQRRKEHLMREIAHARRVSYRRRVALAAAAAAALLVATGFGTYALTRGEPSHVESIGCYDRAALEANVSVIGNTAQDPVEACAELWRRGAVAPGTAEAPPLQPCVLETGAVAVMPGRGAAVCSDLGIAPLPDHERAEFRRLGAVQAALVSEPGVCPAAADVRAAARRALDGSGFTGWVVEGDPQPTSDRPCVGAVIERRERRVLLIATPR